MTLGQPNSVSEGDGVGHWDFVSDTYYAWRNCGNEILPFNKYIKIIDICAIPNISFKHNVKTNAIATNPKLSLKTITKTI